MNYFLAGIKGSGMSHLARYLVQGGHAVSGCDVPEDFFTSVLLDGISVLPSDCSLPDDADCLIYSTSYGSRPLPCMTQAEERGIEVLDYPHALARLSADRITVGICGTHGKSTTCAAASWLGQDAGLCAGSVYGSFLQKSGTVWHDGDRGLVIEACEYQDHFMLYDLDALVITSIAWDHPDWFEDLDAVRRSFRNRIAAMGQGAAVFYHDSLGRLARDWRSERPDITFIPYGPHSQVSLNRNADGSFGVTGCAASFSSAQRSAKILYDYLAGLLAVSCLSLMLSSVPVDEAALSEAMEDFIPHLSGFPGLAGRQEVLFEEDGVTYIDDYAHHPDEIRVCIDSLRRGYPGKRIICLFKSHTDSRTLSMLRDFASALAHCNAVFVQETFAARGDGGQESALRLYKALDRQVFRSFYGRLDVACYTPTDSEAVLAAASCLQSGDILLTLGAGNNRHLAYEIAKERRKALL